MHGNTITAQQVYDHGHDAFKLSGAELAYGGHQLFHAPTTNQQQLVVDIACLWLATPHGDKAFTHRVGDLGSGGGPDVGCFGHAYFSLDLALQGAKRLEFLHRCHCLFLEHRVVQVSFSEGDCTSSLGWPPCVHRTSDRERSEVLCTKRRERSELLRTLVHGATKPEPPKIPAINRQAA
ncbi:hypothetical protein [Enterobacter hormaechei]|uniref:hypothetical protein n=1 Tax=Enterobacter hormaechei TaxID=158836 RepID=UPI000D3BA5AB|nr:hypothetical protein [Enterobacter hormaechei]NGF05773.1 hypothetical protein [Citrobacter freundii]